MPVVGDAAAAALTGAAAAVQLLKGSLALAALLALGALFAPVLLHCRLYSLAFSGAGILAVARRAKAVRNSSAVLCRGRGAVRSMLVLYFFLVFLSTALLLLAGNGGWDDCCASALGMLRACPPWRAGADFLAGKRLSILS